MIEPRKLEPMTPEQTELYRQRQRSRNKVLGIVLISFAILFFAISIVKITAQTGGAG
ncbi:hypothetical protein [Novosphingobium sp. AAP83]|uniref:hypothetical protein n=1 Tax=Novosphingobium sp. AAP83 TaxID=1523425 RepID=UPI000AC4066D|nr:hypothetical protein [Novosphingobium sp. AAP83]